MHAVVGGYWESAMRGGRGGSLRARVLVDLDRISYTYCTLQ